MNKKYKRSRSRKSKQKSKRKSKQLIPKKYLPDKLSSKDKTKQKKMLLTSRKEYKKGKYISRSPVRSYTSKTSSHIINAKKIYNIDKIYPSKKLVTKTGCSKRALTDIVNKGKGAYFSGGSRPNQTASSWGYARLASAITGGKAAAVDFHILEKGCKKKSKALSLAKKSKKKHGKGSRKVPKA
mgnify:FL=1